MTLSFKGKPAVSESSCHVKGTQEGRQGKARARRRAEKRRAHPSEQTATAAVAVAAAAWSRKKGA